MFMPFVAVAAILIGGASVSKANITHVVVGTILFLGIQVVAVPVAMHLQRIGPVWVKSAVRLSKTVLSCTP